MTFTNPGANYKGRSFPGGEGPAGSDDASDDTDTTKRLQKLATHTNDHELRADIATIPTRCHPTTTTFHNAKSTKTYLVGPKAVKNQ